MNLGLDRLPYSFLRKPLLVGGKAMEYHGLRQAGPDIDLVADAEDVQRLISQLPTQVKDLWGDLGLCPLEFEIRASICLFTYEDLVPDAVDGGEHLIISLERLLLMKALAIHTEKYLMGTQLIARRILTSQYERHGAVAARNAALLEGIDGITYLERTGPTT